MFENATGMETLENVGQTVKQQVSKLADKAKDFTITDLGLVKATSFLAGLLTGVTFSKFFKKYAWVFGVAAALLAIPVVKKLFFNGEK